jgi:Domain of unknown function (DUF4430)
MKGMILSRGMLLGLLILICTGCNSDRNTGHPPTSNATSVVMHVHDPTSGDIISYPELRISGKATVREVLNLTARSYPEFQFEDTLYLGMGHLLTSIRGIHNAHGQGAYWQFCIDNQASDTGIDEKKVEAGQTIDWYYAAYGSLPCKKIGE